MRYGGRITTALLLAVAFCAAAPGALAETDARRATIRTPTSWPRLPGRHRHSPHRASSARDSARFLLFSTTDLWRHGGFAHGGVLWAPSGLDQEGPVLKLLFGGGIYHYVSGALGNADVRGTELAAAILPGWRFVRNGISVTVFLGYDFQRHRLRARRSVRGTARQLPRRAHRFRALVSTDRRDDDRGRRIFVHRRARAITCGSRRACARSTPSMSAPRSRPSAPTTTTASSAPASTSRACGPARSSGRSAPAGPPTPTNAAAPTASSACWTRR